MNTDNIVGLDSRHSLQYFNTFPFTRCRQRFVDRWLQHLVALTMMWIQSVIAQMNITCAVCDDLSHHHHHHQGASDQSGRPVYQSVLSSYVWLDWQLADKTQCSLLLTVCHNASLAVRESVWSVHSAVSAAQYRLLTISALNLSRVSASLGMCKTRSLHESLHNKTTQCVIIISNQTTLSVIFLKQSQSYTYFLSYFKTLT